MTAEIYITLKKTVSDPQGLTVRHALESLGYRDLADVRMGKVVVIGLNYEDRARAEKEIGEMCGKLLANPVIEEYRFKIEGQAPK